MSLGFKRLRTMSSEMWRRGILYLAFRSDQLPQSGGHKSVKVEAVVPVPN